MKRLFARAAALALALGLMGLSEAAAQNPAPAGTPIPAVALPALAAEPGGTADSDSPEPYGDGEFPRWLKELGRFEAITVGAFPLMYFYSGMGLDLYRYTSSGFDAAYAPWPFKGPTSYQQTDADRNLRLATALGLSIGVAATDLLIRWLRD